MQYLRLGFGQSLGLQNTRRSRLEFLLRCPNREKSQLNDKKKTGKAIKQLNKENQYLFGELLDRPNSKSNKKAFYRPRPFVQPLDGVQSEILWNKSKRDLALIHDDSSKNIKNNEVSSKHLPRTTSRRNVADEDTGEHILGLDLDAVPTSSQESKLSGPNLQSVDYIQEREVYTDVTSSLPQVIPETSAEKSSLELPDIIVRNIPSFPLFNKEKTVDDHVYRDSILNIARQSSEYMSYPSVSKILNATMSDTSKAALARWRQKMIAELGEEGFLKYSNDLLARGSEFHRTVHDHLSGVPSSQLHVSPEIEGSWHSLSSVTPDLSNVRVLESHVVHPQLVYHGVIDCVAEYRNKLVLIEWKKSDKVKKELAYTYDAPIQLAAYLGAINFDNKYNFEVRGGLVVVAYTDGTPAQVFRLSQADCAHQWSLWLQRLQLYWRQQHASSVKTTKSALP